MFGIEWLDAAWMERYVVPAASSIIFALIIFVIGIWLAGRLRKLFVRIFTRSNLDPILVKFFGDIIYWLSFVAVVLAAVEQLGVNITSLLAIVGAAGLAVGLALKDSLSNFAAGVMLIIFRPYSLGDFIDAGGVSGTVEETGLFSTTMLTPDNKKIIVPNSAIFGGTIVNFSANVNRRIDLLIGIGYKDDIRKAKSIIEKLYADDERILTNPQPIVAVAALGESSIDLFVRPWVKKEDYWGVHSDLQQAIKEQFDAEGISIPFPQRDIHLHQRT